MGRKSSRQNDLQTPPRRFIVEVTYTKVQGLDESTLRGLVPPELETNFTRERISLKSAKIDEIIVVGRKLFDSLDRAGAKPLLMVSLDMH
jgi:hypothetical protein